MKIAIAGTGYVGLSNALLLAQRNLLNKSKMKSTFNIEIPYWKDGLDDCLRRLGERR